MTDEQKAKHKARCATYYAANKARLIAEQMEKRLANPNARKAHDAVYRERNAERVRLAKEAYASANPEKVTAAKRRWRLNNPDKMQAARKSWEKSNPDRKQVYRENRRALEKNAPGRLSPEIAARLLTAQRGKCAACECSVVDRYELDHILPLFLGGGNEDGNLQVLCRTCNRSKGKKHPAVFANERGLLL